MTHSDYIVAIAFLAKGMSKEPGDAAD